MSEATTAEVVRQLVTAHLFGDEEMGQLVVGDLNPADLPTALGIAIADIGNMVKLVAGQWDCEPQEAWGFIQAMREALGKS